MSDPDVLEKSPMSMAELEEEMSDIEERDEELSFRAGRTVEYIKEFDTLSVEEFEDLKKEIESLDVPRLKETHIVKITDFLPTAVEELDIILEGYTLTVNDENKEKIVETVNDFV